MKDRNMRARMCIVLFASLFSSVAFAQVNSIPNRATLAGTDFIDWQSVDDGVGDFTYLSVPDVTSDVGEALVVTQKESLHTLIITEPSPYFRPTNMPVGSYLFETHVSSNNLNPVSFSYLDGRGFCGLGTQIAPWETGLFIARIEAFDAADASMGYFDVNGSSDDPEAAFVGINSSDPMSRVEISIIDTAGGAYAATYAINQVDLKSCSTEPEVPHMSCEGFAPPMHAFPVSAKKNRAFPLKMELFDEGGFAQSDIELISAPVVTVMFTDSIEDETYDVSDEVLATGHGTEGNQFEFTDDGIWQFNLKTKNYSASGTYLISVVSGDESEYVIDPACVTSFMVE